MKLWDVLKNVGAGVVRDVVPGGGVIVDLVNEFLPDEDKLPASATAGQVNSAIAKLPPAQAAKLLDKELSLDIQSVKQSGETLRAMLDADSKSKHTTRPKIARLSAYVVAFAVVVAVSVWAYGAATGDANMVGAIMDGWPFILSVIGPFVMLLRAYFGILRTERKDRFDAATGNQPSSTLSGIINSLRR